MKALASNCSPYMDQGNAAMVLDGFTDGLREAGAEAGLFYLKQLKVKPCQADTSYWAKTPGECFQNDDMRKL